MSTMNQWGNQDPNLDESAGDIIYDELEEKAKDKAKEEAKNLAGKGVRVLDRATDRIKPVKTVKDKIKNTVSSFRNKIRNGTKKLAREGIHAVGQAAANGIKSLWQLILAHPVVSLVIILIALFLYQTMKKDDDTGLLQDDNILQENPMYTNLDGMSDDDVVVILMGDCVDQQYDSMGELDVDKEESARFIYSVFHSAGFNNASIAGMLANIDIESGLDPSALEGIFNEYGFLGSRKAEALLSLTNYTENVLFPKYAAAGLSINRKGYEAINSEGKKVYYCGMGLTQWTGPNGFNLLTAAETLHMDWYNMEFQLAYMLSDCMYRPDFFAEWVEDQETGTSSDPGSWTEAARRSAIKFAHEYEGNTSNDEERSDAAEAWFEIIGGWNDEQMDETYADSIASLATELGGLIEFVDIENAQYRCLSGNVFDNSSLAAAAVSFAWPTRSQSYNNGTNLYQVVHDSIFPTDYIYKACDRTVASAVRWSGSDDTYPRGSTADQLRYLESSSKWEKVGAASSLSMDDLQPGDVFILNGHTFMYVGTSAVQAAYTGEADANSDSVSGSLNERSPACDPSTTSIMNRNGQDWNERGVYNVYRCVNPDNSSTYSSIGSGVTN